MANIILHYFTKSYKKYILSGRVNLLWEFAAITFYRGRSQSTSGSILRRQMSFYLGGPAPASVGLKACTKIGQKTEKMY